MKGQHRFAVFANAIKSQLIRRKRPMLIGATVTWSVLVTLGFAALWMSGPDRPAQTVSPTQVVANERGPQG